MSRQAKTTPGARVSVGEHVFNFGDDGVRNVSQEEERVLRDYERAGAPLKFEFSDTPKASQTTKKENE